MRFAGLPAVETEYELWLPFTDAIELLALRADAPVTPPADRGAVRWLHHGSSISHGYRAESTTGTWPVVAALATDVALTNLAFSGSAMLDPFTARTMRDQPADLISLKVGINLVNGDAMRMRTFRPAVDGFLDTVREGHPSTPIVVVSPIYCEPVERAAGPTVQDPTRPYEWSIAGGTEAEVAVGKLSLGAIRTALAEIVERRRTTDPNLHYVDGLRLYGAVDAERMPLPDNLHPGPDVQRMIGERFAEQVLRPLLHRAGAVMAEQAHSEGTTMDGSERVHEGKVALVTGGSQGIGRGIALTLARRGASVVVHGLTADYVDETVGTDSGCRRHRDRHASARSIKSRRARMPSHSRDRDVRTPRPPRHRCGNPALRRRGRHLDRDLGRGVRRQRARRVPRRSRSAAPHPRAARHA